MSSYKRKSGQEKNVKPEFTRLQNEELQNQTTSEETTSTLLLIAIFLLILSLILTAAVAGLSIYNTVVTETEIIHQIRLLNGSRSGLQLVREGSTIKLFNSGVHEVTGGEGIIVDNTDIHIPIISLNETAINCTTNGTGICLNTTTFVNTTDLFNCSTCFFNGTCDCFNNTIVNQNLTINNITDIIYNNITVFTNESCCSTIISAGPGISVTGPIGDETISNTGVLNISVSTGILQTGPANTPNLAVDFLAGSGISIYGSNPLIFNNTGVLKIIGGQNIIVNSSNGDGTGIVTISLPFQINNINPGLGINITQTTNQTTIINDGVIQNVAGPGINIDSSFGNGKGTVNISNTGVIQIFGGPGVNITGTNQFPVINFSPVKIDALTGIFVNNSGNTYNIGNIGVLQIIPGNGITVSPSNGVGVVNISSNCLSSLTAGTAIQITTSGSVDTIAARLQAGTGIAISGATVSADLAAGSGISITGTNPLVISSTVAGSILSTPNIAATLVSPGVYQLNLADQRILTAQLCGNAVGRANCNIGVLGAQCGLTGLPWTCGDLSAPNNGCQSFWSQAYSEFTIPLNGTYYVSYSVEDSFTTTGISLMLMTSNPSCARCITGVGACTYQRLITVGGLNPIGGSSTNAVASSFFSFQAGQIISLQELQSVGMGTIHSGFANNNANGIVTYFSIYLMNRT